MTRKLFWDDPYRTELDTQVVSVTGAEITLAETIFYAESGGQESDAGSIGGWPVLNARKDGLEIIYTLAEGNDLKPGDPVRQCIDWERRYRLMRLHFAAELVLELVYRALPSVEKIGAHIAANKARIDFAWPENLSGLLPTIQTQAHDLIAADHPIRSAFSDEAAQRRYWEIEGFARVSCGGTHLRRTSEVGLIDLKRRNVGKEKERIEITVQ
ncbi:MAG: alanyl-tRNA editing protein [Anaerolineae bacterium]|nr:alanyl-tRNA editing protein [Anaerolineae bacterium]